MSDAIEPIEQGSPAAAFLRAIRQGAVEELRALVQRHPDLATARFGRPGDARSALHLVTDHPGHVPNVADVIDVLVAAGAEVDARYVGSHRETPLHWAASSDDVAAIDALVAHGADLEADGGVLTDGPPLDDAVIFEQWNAAARLVAHGATTKLFHAAALGLDDRVAAILRGGAPADEITSALWHACRAGRAGAVASLLEAGGDPHWSGYDDLTPAMAARRSGNAACAAMFA